ncbi:MULTISPECIES: hypothetical protein [Mycobacterium]|nr:MULTISPECIES: hypothetical protein [Mycobacterium]AFC54314.1 enoyl-CoA hydratase/isomerase [Mycobacterium paraintracellulare]WSE53751.1 hypothetical protein QGN31_12395 [Mycobacterium sp. 2-64]
MNGFTRQTAAAIAARDDMSNAHIGNAGANPDSLNNKKRPRTR